MKRITLITIITIFTVILFGVSSFAANNMASDAVEGVRNVVGGSENVVEGAIGGITNGVKNTVSATENTVRNTGDTMQNDREATNSGYNVARTATTRMATNTGSNTFLGMGATAWGWLIMAIVGIVTVALVWYYGKEHESNYSHNDDNY